MGRTEHQAVAAVLLATFATLAACGVREESRTAPSPSPVVQIEEAQRAVESLCRLQISGIAEGEAAAAFGVAHDSLHEIAAAVETLDRSSAARLLEAVSFFVLAAYVTFESVRDLVAHTEPGESVPGIVLAALSLVVMPVLAVVKRRTGEAMGSATLIADAAETMLCSLLSLVLLIGLVLNATVGWWWADPVAAIGIALLALREGLEAWRGDDHQDESDGPTVQDGAHAQGHHTSNEY